MGFNSGFKGLIMWKLYFFLTNEAKERGGRKMHEVKRHDWYFWPSIFRSMK